MKRRRRGEVVRMKISAGAPENLRRTIQRELMVRDNEVIAAADEANIAMVFTGERHFRH